MRVMRPAARSDFLPDSKLLEGSYIGDYIRDYYTGY